jgi:hypothetical protein
MRKIQAEAIFMIGVLMVAIALMPLSASACELAGPDTHVGEIKAIDLGQPSFTILDGQMKKPLTFLAAPEQLKGLSPGQLVVVKYSKVGGQLRAEEIQAR